MIAYLHGSHHIATTEGYWLPVSELEGSHTLLSLRDGKLEPVPVSITKYSEQDDGFTYKIGGNYTIKTPDDLEFLTPDLDWKPLSEMFFVPEGQTQADPKLYREHNKILIPNRCPVEGSLILSEDERNYLKKELFHYLESGKALIIPDILFLLPLEHSLDILLYSLNRRLYYFFPSHWIVKKAHNVLNIKFKIRYIARAHYSKFQHLMYRFGVRFMYKKNEERLLITRSTELFKYMDLLQKRIICDVDISKTEVFWTKHRENDSVYRLETKADNIFDGGFIWRKRS